MMDKKDLAFYEAIWLNGYINGRDRSVQIYGNFDPTKPTMKELIRSVFIRNGKEDPYDNG